MKKDWRHLDKYRHSGSDAASSPAGATYGAFQIPTVGSRFILLNCIATDGFDGEQDTGWEHVSVHAFDIHFQRPRTPTWLEMDFVKDMFWEPSECVVQFHVPKVDHINIHEHVLHLWRCKTAAFPLPPRELV